jgi:hypothetical protein
VIYCIQCVTYCHRRSPYPHFRRGRGKLFNERNLPSLGTLRSLRIVGYFWLTGINRYIYTVSANLLKSLSAPRDVILGMTCSFMMGQIMAPPITTQHSQNINQRDFYQKSNSETKLITAVTNSSPIAGLGLRFSVRPASDPLFSEMKDGLAVHG